MDCRFSPILVSFISFVLLLLVRCWVCLRDPALPGHHLPMRNLSPNLLHCHFHCSGHCKFCIVVHLQNSSISLLHFSLHLSFLTLFQSRRCSSIGSCNNYHYYRSLIFHKRLFFLQHHFTLEALATF